MAVRLSNILRAVVVLGAVITTFVTINLYIGLFERWSKQTKGLDVVKVTEIQAEKPEVVLQMEKKEEEPKPPELPAIKMANFPCSMKQECKTNTEISFRIVSGAANIIGPSVCVDDKWLFSNSLNNVKRGLNVAAIDGNTGKMTKTDVFDLYGETSEKFLAFLKERTENEILFFATFDDATQKMDVPARDAITALGSERVQKLGFRDNWIFVGGSKLKKPTGLEEFLANEKDKNKFGKWPGTITLEGCIPKFT